VAFRDVPRHPLLYPAVSLHARGEVVTVNLGTAPFKFDTAGHVRAARSARVQRLKAVPLPAALPAAVIGDFLLHYGYGDTLDALRASLADLGLGGAAGPPVFPEPGGRACGSEQGNGTIAGASEHGNGAANGRGNDSGNGMHTAAAAAGVGGQANASTAKAAPDGNGIHDSFAWWAAGAYDLLLAMDPAALAAAPPAARADTDADGVGTGVGGEGAEAAARSSKAARRRNAPVDGHIGTPSSSAAGSAAASTAPAQSPFDAPAPASPSTNPLSPAAATPRTPALMASPYFRTMGTARHRSDSLVSEGAAGGGGGGGGGPVSPGGISAMSPSPALFGMAPPGNSWAGLWSPSMANAAGVQRLTAALLGNAAPFALDAGAAAPGSRPSASAATGGGGRAASAVSPLGPGRGQAGRAGGGRASCEPAGRLRRCGDGVSSE
jgi:hypothetical protein